MHSQLVKNLSLEFDNKDNLIKIIDSDYTLSLKSQILVDWKFQKKETIFWQISLSYKKDQDKDFTTNTHYICLDSAIDPKNKSSVLRHMNNLYSDISYNNLSLTRKDINSTRWVRCEELLFTKNF